MITLAVGCMAMGRLYQVVRLITVGDILDRFQLGVLGIIGSLIFFFSANFGVMDTLSDDGSKKFLKYRLIPLAAPVAAAASYIILFLTQDYPAFSKIIAGVITFVIICASYYNLKHLIFPDVDFGVINCLKPYNALALVFEALCIVEMYAQSRRIEALGVAVGVLMGVILLAIVPVVERGIKKWTT